MADGAVFGLGAVTAVNAAARTDGPNRRGEPLLASRFAEARHAYM